VDISCKDDVTIILLIGVSIMLYLHTKELQRVVSLVKGIYRKEEAQNFHAVVFLFFSALSHLLR
jgi:hypothetical protein